MGIGRVYNLHKTGRYWSTDTDCKDQDMNGELSGRLIGYARVSTEDQKLRMQVDALSAAGCKQLFHDHGVSGTKAKRPGLDAMLDFLRDGDTVIVYKLDRLGRSVQHLSDLLKRLNGMDVQFRSLTEGIDTNTIGGRLVFHIFSAVAEFQRDLIAENTREGLQAAKRRGKRLGRPNCLSEDQIAYARKQIRTFGRSPRELGQELGVSHMSVLRAI